MISDGVIADGDFAALDDLKSSLRLFRSRPVRLSLSEDRVPGWQKKLCREHDGRGRTMEETEVSHKIWEVNASFFFVP